jgi:protein-L-isoaspartate(D-aspartate) O-methyltransferase
MDDSAARLRMVEEQIEARGVHDPRVLHAMRSVPRHVFVPDAMKHEAYDDRPLPIGEGQTISQPYMVASMTAVLGPRETDRVLEIGTGSGYQTAILATLAAEVISVERHASLATAAAARCASLGFLNIRVIVGDGTEGAADWAPFDRILVTAGAPAVPETLKAQLAEGGRLVIPVGPPGFQRLVAIDLHDGRFAETSGEGCVFVPLIGRHGWSPHH